MPTHDYILDNASGAAFRTDLNNALAAIVSNNSNSSSPATTYAYQWWADTSNAVLKIRNSANSDWIELFQLDGTLTLEDGSVSTPALAFRDDLNTGIFSSAADTFNVATGGVERMELGATTIFNEDGADVDFRIEGDTDANLFNLDESADAIGIGAAPITTGPKFEVTRSTTDDFVNATDCIVRIINSDTSANTNQASLQFTTKTTSTGDDSAIVSQAEDASGNSRLEFYTDVSNGMTEKMVITSAGLVGIGRTAPSQILHIRAANPFLEIEGTAASSGDSGIFLNANGNHWLLRADNNGSSNIFSIKSGDTSSSTHRLAIDSSGNVLAGTTSADGDGLSIKPRVANSTTRVVFNRADTSDNGTAIQFLNNDVTVGTIRHTNSSTTFNTSSDYRLKENATAISDGITRLKTLKPYRFNFKIDASKTVDGFFAHEVTAVPEAISGEKDAVNEDGSINPQGIDQSKLVPLLVAAVQELITKVETLEAA